MLSDTLCYMSKPVRLPDYLAAEVQKLADQEKRSLANMVKVLLEQALGMSNTLTIRDGTGTIVDHVSTTKGSDLKPTSADDHFKPDFK